MATTQNSLNNTDEDYIDMEVSSSSSSSSSSSNFISFSISSPPHVREFEFQMCSSAANSVEPTTSPADELFYKGQLLPLHLPPRLQMVQKILESSNSESDGENSINTSFSVSTATIGTTNTPFESRAISPSESRRASSEINPDEYFIELSAELKNFIDNGDSRNSWGRKIKQIKQSLIGQRIKASRAYIKSLFTKSGSSESEVDSKAKDGGKKFSNMIKKKNPFGKIETFDDFNGNNNHRRSFSGVIQKHCPTKCLSSVSSGSSSSSLSSSFSFGSNGSLDLQSLKRSSSASSEIENSIERAIAHCKQSFSPRMSNASEVSRNSASGDKERPKTWRI